MVIIVKIYFFALFIENYFEIYEILADNCNNN